MKHAFAILGIAFALALDAFAVSFGAGVYFKKATRRQIFRLSFHFGLFQFFMPIIGWAVGSKAAAAVGDYDHWIAFVILAVLGSKMIYSSFSSEERKASDDASKGKKLIALSIATSIDALAVGFSFGLLNDAILFPSVVIGAVASLMSFIGVKLGEKASFLLGKRAEAFGGLILIGIGLQILLEHSRISLF